MADIQNKKHKNWYRGAIATLITKKAVAPFSEDVISDFVEQLIVDINTINNRESGFVCRSCKIQNLLPCPTRGFCSVSKGDCKFHSTPDLIPAFCPNGLCDKIRDKIILNHRFSSPSWKNTKPEEWCTNVWQVAKCFFPPDGYIDVCHPEDTDFNGIISLIINCTLFQNHVSDNLSNKGNVFDQAREVGKSIRHSPSLHVSNTELSGYYDVLVALLSDATLQQSNLATKQALRKLRKLKASPLVTSIEEEIADESLKSCSSDESLSDCLKQTISKSDIFWDSSDCSSIVDDGVETDTDSGETYSSSISSEDSHDEKSTADQPGEWVIKGSASRINSWPLQCLGNQNLHHLFDFPGESKIVTPTTSPFRLYGQEATEDGSMATGTIMLHLDENMNIFSIDRTPTTAHEVQTSRAIHEVPISIDVKKVQTPRAVNEMQTSRAVDEMQPSSTVYDLPISIDVNKVQTPSAVYATQISSTVHEMKTSSALHEVQTSSAVYQVPISSAVEEVQTTPSAALGVQTSSAVYEVPILSAVKEVQTTPSAALGMQTSSAVYEVPISSAVNEVQTTPSAALWVQTSSNVHELQTTSRAIHEVLISKATDELQTSGSRSSESQPMSTVRLIHVLLVLLVYTVTTIDGKHQTNAQRRCVSARKNYFSLLKTTKACSTGTYVCEKANGGNPSCIQKEFLCDGERHCPNGDDEINCEPVCRSGEYTCDGGQCATFCNGTSECDGGDDEDRCACGVNEFRCDNGTCVPRCNDNAECDSGADEENCPCPSGRVRCSNGACAMKCDGARECPDGSDEAGCQKDCAPTQVKCSSGQCATLCNRDVECTDMNDAVKDEDPFFCYGRICRGQSSAVTGCTTLLTSGLYRLCGGNGSMGCHPLKGRLEQCPNGPNNPCNAICEPLTDLVQTLACIEFGYTSGIKLASQTFGMSTGDISPVDCSMETLSDCRGVDVTCDQDDVLHIECTP